MSIKRRGFVKGLIVTPAVPLVAHQTPGQAKAPSAPATAPQTPGKLAIVAADTAAQTTQRFFTPGQFAALEKLGATLVPPLQGKPGATEAGAALFLDFLVSVSPHDRQQLYRNGLDGLNITAEKHFNKPFAELDAAQVGVILKPLMVVRLWPEEMPEDPMQHFIAQAHQDLRTATSNSREWADASLGANGGGRRGFNQAIGLYWNPIDPVVKG
jgi:hypothetical protein